MGKNLKTAWESFKKADWTNLSTMSKEFLKHPLTTSTAGGFAGGAVAYYATQTQANEDIKKLERALDKISDEKVQIERQYKEMTLLSKKSDNKASQLEEEKSRFAREAHHFKTELEYSKIKSELFLNKMKECEKNRSEIKCSFFGSKIEPSYVNYESESDYKPITKNNL